MILRLVVTSLLSLCLASGLFAQQRLGPSSGPQFLHISPSVRGIAMGQTAVISLDSRSYYFNPGSLALINVQRVALSFNPASSRLGEFGSTDFKFHSEGIIVRLVKGPLGGGSFNLAFGTCRPHGPLVHLWSVPFSKGE